MKHTFKVFLALIIFIFCQCSKKKGTCSDGILNQNETSVDCGGKCSKCATCSDGMQNQGETSVDCGGPCGNCSFSYPAFGNYGGNILRNDTITIQRDSITGYPLKNLYSLCAFVPEKSTVRVKIFNPTSSLGVASFGEFNTWRAITITPEYQEFFRNFPGKSDLLIFFTGHSTSRIEIYENSASSPTRTKTISW